MKQTLLLITLLMVSWLGVNAPLHAQDADALVKKCVETMGGEEAVSNFADFKAEGRMTMSFGPRQMNGTFTQYTVGNKSYFKMEVKFGSRNFLVIRAFDGKQAWMDRMGSIADQPVLNDQSRLDHGIDLLINKDAVFSMGSNTEIDGKKVLAVEALYKNKKTTFYIGSEDYMVKEIQYSDLFFNRNEVKESLEKRMRFSDYKKLGNGLFPHKWVTFNKGQKEGELTMEKITLKPEVTAQLFARPDQAPDLRDGDERLH